MKYFVSYFEMYVIIIDKNYKEMKEKKSLMFRIILMSNNMINKYNIYIYLQIYLKN